MIPTSAAVRTAILTVLLASATELATSYVVSPVPPADILSSSRTAVPTDVASSRTRMNVATTATFLGNNDIRQQRTQPQTKQEEFGRRRSAASSNRREVWLDEFRTGSGEIVDPYTVLNVARDADRSDIRASYVDLSRMFHPDSARHQTILPGNCESMDEVRDEWERISLSYRILSDRRTRIRYDRHEAVANPGPAFRRLAFNVISASVVGIGKGVVAVGTHVINSLSKAKDAAVDDAVRA